jgi:hypothetical protein
MAKPSRKPRFQIHLSTAIALMFTAGALIWANTREYMWSGQNVSYYCHGWPLPAVIAQWTFIDAWQNSDAVPIFWYVPEIALDLAVALLILSTVYFACEWQIRRRASRKEG